MSLPRPIHKGTRYLLTRRTAQRQFLLRPDALTNAILLYAMAHAAMITGVVIHALVALSNHIHLVVTDVDGRLPEFLHMLHRHVACCMNVALDRSEAFWSSDPPSVVELEGDEDVIDKVAYVYSNPTTAHLVADPAEWPGAISPIGELRMNVERPGVFFRKNGRMPPFAELIVAPPVLESCDGVEDVLRRIRDAVREKIEAAHREVAAAKTSFLGAKRVLAMSPWAYPSKPETGRSGRPQLAARRKDQRASALDRLRAFLAHYSRALHAWRAGDRTAMFPAGTYLMRIRHGALVEEPLICRHTLDPSRGFDMAVGSQ